MPDVPITSDVPPLNPAEGQTWRNPITGRVYTWQVSVATGRGFWIVDGRILPVPQPPVVTTATAVTRTPQYTIGPVPPASPIECDLWWNSENGQEFVYYNDGNSFQWVVTNSVGEQGPPGPQGVQGPTGPQGVIGPRGVVGPAGPLGPQGVQGVQGIAGPTGPQGIVGPAGVSIRYVGEGPWPARPATPSINDGYLLSVGDMTGAPIAPDGNPASIGDVVVWTAALMWENFGKLSGVPGTSAYSTLTANFAMPAVGLTNVANVINASWAGTGQTVFVETLGYLQVTAKTAGTLTLQNPGYVGNALAGVVATIGKLVSPGGLSGGNALVTTSTVPPSAPVDTQLWWHSAEGELYIRYNDGNSVQWVPAHSNVPAVGPQGPPGTPGATGATGATGAQGDTGLQGPTGNTGSQGPQGVQGPQGPLGLTGPQGIQGIPGPTGPEGPTGPAGADGTGSGTITAVNPGTGMTGGGTTGAVTLNVDTGVIATNAAVAAAVAPLSPVDSPTFTGDPKAPNPAVDDNDTSLATTQWVMGQKATIAQLRAGTNDLRFVTPKVMYDAAAIVPITWAASMALDFASFINGSITLAGNTTFPAPTGVVAGKSGIIKIVVGTGGQTVAFNATNYKFFGGPPVASLTTGAIDTVTYYAETATLLLCTYLKAAS